MTEAFICLGSNLGTPEQNLTDALERIENEEGIRVKTLSSVYFTEPQNVKEQPWFANRVACLECDEHLSATELLKILLRIEIELGRDRSGAAVRFGPRMIDLDILFFGQDVVTSEFLTLPHPRMTERAFVLVPLAEIAGDMALPGKDLLVRDALNALSYRMDGQKIWQDE